MTITINPTMITANVVGIFPLVVSVTPSIAINPVIGGVGIKGDKGDRGDAVFYTAGEALSGHCAVTIGSDGKIYQASALFYQPIAGITTMAADIDTSIEVKNSGAISMIGWNFALNSPVFVLANGQLSTTPDPMAQFSTVVGVSNSSTSMVVGIQPQIKLN